MEIDGSVSHTGRKSLKIIGITATGVASHTKVRHELVPAEEGKTCTVAFWAKVDAEQGQSREVDVSVQTQDDRWPGFYDKAIVIDSTDWKEYTDTFELVSDSTVEAVWVGLCIAQSDVDFWIDDFRFFQGTPVDEIRDVETATTPSGKLSVAWGRIRIRQYR